MTITPSLFEAYLKCPTKCWLRSTGEPTAGNAYAEWVQSQNESFRAEAAKRLAEEVPANECALAPPDESLKTADWRLAVEVAVRIESRSSRGDEAQTSRPPPSTPGPQPVAPSLPTPPPANSQRKPVIHWAAESRLDAVERVPSEGRGKAAQFIPIRFIYRNKLTSDDRLLLAFDAFVLSGMLGREISLGKIIHGDDRATLKVKTSALFADVRKSLEKITAVISSPAPPDLVLIRHCAECEFQARCRKIAIEKDDLSLLAGMSAQERQKLRSKGIFTVTQLSYTFRPRRRPKRLRDKREKYHHSLKALAIREKKIHIVGSPELKIEGTPVYLDVEGLPDRDFYYLIGLRIGNGESAVQHSLWADNIADEGKIWRQFLAILETVEKPVLIHYGSYETIFLKRMCDCYSGPNEDPIAVKVKNSAINLLSVTFAQIYFPTRSNGLKEIAAWLGWKWSEDNPSGTRAISWRMEWEAGSCLSSKQRLIAYNTEDCTALDLVSGSVKRLECRREEQEINDKSIVRVESLKIQTMWPKFSSPISEFEQMNKAARWDYQRDRVYVRSSKVLKQLAKRDAVHAKRQSQATSIVNYPENPFCPRCDLKGHRHLYGTQRILYDVHLGRSNIRKRIAEYKYRIFWCSDSARWSGFRVLARGPIFLSAHEEGNYFRRPSAPS